MKLADLEGIQMLDGVDFGTGTAQLSGSKCNINIMRVRLCGVIYVFGEGPYGGYRSMLDNITIDNELQNPIKTLLPMTLVDCKVRKDNDILEIFDRANGKLIIEVGTNRDDSYYPSCVMHWNPENLHINEGK